MSDERLSEIRARYSTTTKGEWGYDLNGTVAVIEADGEWGISVCQIPRGSRYATNQDRCDMEFIAMAHKYLPALVDENERLRKENEIYRDKYVTRTAYNALGERIKEITEVNERLRAELQTTRDHRDRLFFREADLREALKEVVSLSDRKHDAWGRAKEAIAKSEGK